MTFRFIYKSARKLFRQPLEFPSSSASSSYVVLGTLKNMGLIERSPSPHLNTERDPSPARSGPVKNEKGQLKRERDNSPGLSGRRKILRPQRVSRDDIETIDLTGED